MVTTYHDQRLWPTHYCPPEGWHVSMNVGAGVRNCPLICRLMGHNQTVLFAHKLMSLEALMWQKYLQEFYLGEDLRDMWFVCKHLKGYYMEEEWACSLRLQRTGKKTSDWVWIWAETQGQANKGNSMGSKIPVDSCRGAGFSSLGTRRGPLGFFCFPVSEKHGNSRLLRQCAKI